MEKSTLAVLLSLVPAATLSAQLWTELSSSTRPDARKGATMAFDGKNSRVMMFGGDVGYPFGSPMPRNGTWLLNGSTWSVASPVNAPSPRSNHAMTYDAARGEVVLFGGYHSGDVFFNGTWVWNGTDWTLRTPVTSPPARRDHALAYDPVRQRVLLFGGTLGDSSKANDTWAWDGANWQVLQPAARPPARYGHAMAWHEGRQAIVLYGGDERTDTWEWNGSAWVDKTTPLNPGSRVWPAMVGDGTRVLLFGGELDSWPANDTWEWDGSVWKLLVTPVAPPARQAMAAAYDSDHGQMVIFGGQAPGDSRLSDSWAFTYGMGCSFGDAAPPRIDVAPAGGTVEIPISISAGCAWTASTNAAWITLLSSSGTGPGKVRLSAGPSTGSTGRSAEINVGGRAYRVYQAPPACPAGGALPAGPVLLQNECDITWTFNAAAGDSLALRSIGSGSTYGPRDQYQSSFATIEVRGPAPSTTLISRSTGRQPWNPIVYLPDSGVLTFASAGIYSISVELYGGPYGDSRIDSLRTGRPCAPAAIDYYIYGPPTEVHPEYTADWEGVTPQEFLQRRDSVALAPGCAPVSVTSNQSWVQPSHASISPGFTTLTLAIDPNYGSVRTAEVSVGSLVMPVRQDASECSFSLDSSGADAPAGLSTGSVQLTSVGNSCPWTASSGASWLQPFPLSGWDSGKIQYTVFPNFGSSSRQGSLQIAGQNLTVTQAPGAGTGTERFIRLLYFSFFGRLPSAAEVAFQISSAQSREQLALNFFQSEEFNAGGRFVAGLYVGILNRNAEYGGWLFQRNALSSGAVNHTSIVSNFLTSAEFVERTGTLDDRAFVALMYRQILLREPAAREVDFHAGTLGNGLSRTSLARNFLSGTEFRDGAGPRLTAFLAYATLLQRQATTTEFASAAAIAQQAQAIGDVRTRQALIRDQLLAPLVNGNEMNTILQ